MAIVKEIVERVDGRVTDLRTPHLSQQILDYLLLFAHDLPVVAQQKTQSASDQLGLLSHQLRSLLESLFQPADQVRPLIDYHVHDIQQKDP